jgi:hypothetical protein
MPVQGRRPRGIGRCLVYPLPLAAVRAVAVEIALTRDGGSHLVQVSLSETLKKSWTCV